MKRFGKFVRRITFLQPTTESRIVPALDKRARKKRKISRGLRRFEKRKRRVLQARAAFANEMLARHEQSNQARRDGFLRDRVWNLMKSRRKAWKRLTRI